MEENRLGELRYVVRYPKNFDPQKKYPILIHLHGSGTRNRMDKVKTNPLFKALDRMGQPFVAVAPLCEKNTWFDHLEDLKEWVRYLTTLPFADPARLYLAGLSMGGYGAWQLAMSIPEYFAALVPICGGGMYWNAGRLKNVPVWAFHGGKDPIVLPEESEKMVAAVNRRGGCAKLTIFPENEHNAWDDAYDTPELYDWLLSQKNEGAEIKDTDFRNAEIYG